MKILIPAILILGLAFIGLAVRVIFIKGGKFSKKCSTSEIEGDGTKSCVCGGADEENHSSCQYYKEHHPEN